MCLRLNNDFKLTHFAFDVLQKFEAEIVSEPIQANNRDIINMLLVFSPSIINPRASRLDHKSKEKNSVRNLAL